MILVTGTAGFIGYHLTQRLLAEGEEVVGIDVINDYYDTRIKLGRLESAGIDTKNIIYGESVISASQPRYEFIQLDIKDAEALQAAFNNYQFEVVVHLAAQAGVRYSLNNPRAYIDSNIIGFLNILEACRHHGIKHLVYASSSSVYGLNERMPLSTNDNVDHPISFYAATKKSNELMAHSYSHLFGLPTTGLRFFTVYGPWGRPDMAFFLFTEAILRGNPIKVFNYGNTLRDFTYIDDIVEGIVRAMNRPPSGNVFWSGMDPLPGTSPAPYRLYNIGSNKPIKLLNFIEMIEEELHLKADKIFMDRQPGDVPATFADIRGLVEDFGYQPKTPLREGIRRFVKWYKTFYELSPD